MPRPKIPEIEKSRGKTIREILPELYEKLGSQTAIADELGVSQGTISLWMKDLGLAEKKVLVKKERA